MKIMRETQRKRNQDRTGETERMGNREKLKRDKYMENQREKQSEIVREKKKG